VNINWFLFQLNHMLDLGKNSNGRLLACNIINFMLNNNKKALSFHPTEEWKGVCLESS